MKSILLIIFFFNLRLLFSQFETPDVQKYSVSTYGTEFNFSLPSKIDNSVETAEIYLFSEFNCDVKIKGSSFNTDVQLIANQKKVILVPSEDVFAEIIEQGQILAKSSFLYSKKALNIKSTKPIKVYVKYSSIATEATQLFPDNCLGNDYILQSYAGRNLQVGNLSPLGVVTAVEDETELNIIIGGLNSSQIKYQDKTYNYGDTLKLNLNKGDVFQIANFIDKDVELSGTRIQSNKKINVISGHYCADVPLGNFGCNYLLESNIPVSSFGKVHYIPELPNRMYPGIIRIYAIESGTKIYENDEEILSLSNSKPGLKGNSWEEYRLNDKSEIIKHSVISSNKPIGISFLITGGAQEDNTDVKPAQNTILPVDFYYYHSNLISLESNTDNFEKLILMNLPLENNSLQITNYFKGYSQNDWKVIKDFYSNINMYNNEYANLLNFDGAFEGEILTEEPHFYSQFAMMTDKPNSFIYTNTEVLWNLNSNDKKQPTISIVDTTRDENNFLIQFSLNDEEIGLNRCFILENDDFLLDTILGNSTVQNAILAFEITPEIDKIYKIIAVDNSNNKTEFEIPNVYKLEEEEEEEKELWDSVYVETGFIDFDLIELGTSKSMTFELSLETTTTSEIIEISLQDENNVFDLTSNIELPYSFTNGEKISININYLPLQEYTKLEETSPYGKVDFSKLIVKTTNNEFGIDIIGKAGVARLYHRYNNNGIIDTMSFGVNHQIRLNKFFIQNYNIDTKEDGTYNLEITGLNMDSIYTLNGIKLDPPDNINFKGAFELDENFNFVNPLVLEPGELVYYNNEIEFQGIRAGHFDYYIPIICNAINVNSEMGILHLEFIVFDDESSVTKLNSDDYYIENNQLIINKLNFDTETEVSLMDINGKSFFKKLNLLELNTIDLTKYKNQAVILIIHQKGKMKFAKILN